MRRIRIGMTLLAMGAALFSTLFFYTSNTAADDDLRRPERHAEVPHAATATPGAVHVHGHVAQLAGREALDGNETARAIRVDTAAPEHFAALLDELHQRELIDPG